LQLFSATAKLISYSSDHQLPAANLDLRVDRSLQETKEPNEQEIK